MTQNATSLDVVVVAVSIVIVGLYFLSCYAVARYWRLNRGRSLSTGWILSFFLTPLVGWIVGMLLAPNRAAIEDAGSLHEVFQETYREVDEKLHAHS